MPHFYSVHISGKGRSFTVKKHTKARAKATAKAARALGMKARIVR